MGTGKMARSGLTLGLQASHPALGKDGPDGDDPDRPGQEAATGYFSIPELVRQVCLAQPAATAVICGRQSIDYGALDGETARIAAWLQATGHRHGDRVVLLGAASVAYVTALFGILRAGLVAVPLPRSATREVLLRMIADAGAKTVFADLNACRELGLPAAPGLGLGLLAKTLELDAGAAADQAGAAATDHGPIAIGERAPFNIIYSSGTTGAPKGIVQSHGMRWSHVDRARLLGYGPGCVTLISTPLYSNTTLVALLPTLALGGTVVLMDRFDTCGYLALAEEHQVTHTMLVPVQYRRLMDEPAFERFALDSFRQKLCTSAPFGVELKREILDRWPGGLTEYYGMTEGGGTCMLKCHEYPDKLHTVGQPLPGHDLRLIDDSGQPVLAGQAGEVVGRSPAMMLGYHNRGAQTREIEWFDSAGHRYIRTGDVGTFDDDGFLQLLDRKKDLIISGGFNIYPSDLEQILRTHENVADASVVGVPSERWGETPVAWVVLRKRAEAVRDEAEAPHDQGKAPHDQGKALHDPGAAPHDQGKALHDPGAAPHDQGKALHDPAEALRDQGKALLEWVNARVGKHQRLADLNIVSGLPRSTIGKVLKRELRNHYIATLSARDTDAGKP